MCRALISAPESIVEKKALAKTLRENVVLSVLCALSDGHSRIVANYHVTTAGPIPLGDHFSTLAAYHGVTDRFVTMDC